MQKPSNERVLASMSDTSPRARDNPENVQNTGAAAGLPENAPAPSSASAKPLSWDLHIDGEELSRRLAALQSAGIRKWPYPFRSVGAVTSDIDRANRTHYRAYIDQMVRDHGLDFGDSVFLHTNEASDHHGLGFYDSRYCLRQPDEGLKTQMDHHDLLRESHRGNVDHWHGFMVRGPRFAILDKIERVDGGRKLVIEVPKPPRENDPIYGVKPFELCGLVLVVPKGSGAGILKATAVPRSMRLEAFELAIRTPAPANAFAAQDFPGADVIFAAFDRPVDTQGETASLPDLKRIEIELDAPVSEVKTALALNIYERMLAERFDFLRDTYAVNFNLITVHATWSIIPQKAYLRTIANMREAIENRGEELISFTGSATLGGVAISTMADEEHSFARLYPDPMLAQGTYYWRTSGNCLTHCRNDRSIEIADILEAVTPMRTRNGAHVYNINTEKGRPVEPFTGDVKLDRKTISRNFVPRFSYFLDEIKAGRSEFGIHYTHLGNLFPDDKNIPSPYFDEALFERLRKLVFGINHRSEDGPRLWFTRASVVSDYAMLLNQIAGHVSRPGVNDVEIARFTEPYLGVTVPHSAAQFYGQTYYVEDASAAHVRLDGAEIPDLVRNPPDETGRPSVTVADCPIGYTVFRSLDPAETGILKVPSAGTPAKATYVAATDNGGEPFLRVHAEAGAVDAPEKPGGLLSFFRRKSVDEPIAVEGAFGAGLDVAGREPYGAQVFRMRLRRSAPGVEAGVLIETEAGGLFFFGSPGLRGDIAGLDGWYDSAAPANAEGWETHVVPLWALTWAESADVLRRPLPATSPAKVSVIVREREGGGTAAHVDVADLSFRRPRTAQEPHGDRVVIGGRIGALRGGVEITLTQADGRGAHSATTHTDDLGGFHFAHCPPGGYRLNAATGASILVECFEHRYDIDLRR